MKMQQEFFNVSYNFNLTIAKNFSVSDTPDQYCANYFSGRLALSNEESLLVTVTLCLLIPLTLISNILVIRFLVQAKQLGRISSYLIFVLSLADLGIGLIVLPMEIVLFTVYQNIKVCGFEIATQFASNMIAHTSVEMIAVIAVDRVIHFRKVLKYDSIMSKTKVNLLITFVVVMSLIFATALSISSISGYFYMTGLVLSFIDLGLLSIIVFSYVSTYYNIWSFVKNSVLWKRRNSQVPVSSKNTKPKYLSKLGNIIFLMLLSVCLCYLPYGVLACFMLVKVFIYGEEIPKNIHFGLILSFTLIYSNSVINAMIFLFKSSRRRQVGIEPYQDVIPFRNKYKVT